MPPKNAKKAKAQPKKAIVKMVPTRKTSRPRLADPFRVALTQPFDERADGARVPDLFSAPTETRSFKQSFNLTSDASGNIDYIGFANPKFVGLSTRGNVSGGGTFTFAANSAVTINSAVPSGVGADLSGELVTYRVVGWGLRLTTISSMTTTTGVVAMASVPYATYVPHEITIGGQSHTSGNSGTLQDWILWTGIPSVGQNIDVSKLPAMDFVEERSATSLATTPLQFTSRPIDPRAYNFRFSGDNRFGYDIQGQTSTTYINAGNASQADASGWLIPVIGGSGFPASSTCLRVEVIYHLEGVPAYFASSMHSGGASSSPVDFQRYVKVLSDVANTPPIKSLVGAALNATGLSPLAHLIL